ncbi:MAG: hypothetical protein SH819_05060 [Cytophagales bacterium]|nr:hypothetical protein [Cytophagales bacterium]
MKNPKAIAATMTALLLVCVLWLSYQMRTNSTLEESMNSEKLKTESLLSEKLLLEKDISKFRAQLSSLTGKNQELDKVLKQTSARLDVRENEFNRIKKENQSLNQIRKQSKEVQALKKELEKELEATTASYKAMQLENKKLSMSVASLEEKNKMLTDELQKAMLASVDYTQFDAVRGTKGILTVKASRTRKLIANFIVPSGLKNISYRVIDPSGNALTEKDGTIASRVVVNAENYTVSASNGSSAPHTAKPSKMEMTYKPARKLKPGTYRVELLSDNQYVGSTQVRLR